MKLFIKLFLIFSFFINIFSLKKIVFQTFKQFTNSGNTEYIFRWWDLIEIKKDDEICESNHFTDLRFLSITCKDSKIGKWAREQKGIKNIDYFAVIPAQALFYKLKDFQHEKIKYLTVTWNDFSNREKAIISINKIFDLIKEDCSGEKRIVFLIFPTSDKTMNGSKINFQDKKTSIFSQEIIEDKLINYQNKCIKRKILKEKKQKNPIAYWVEFQISLANDKILLER